MKSFKLFNKNDMSKDKNMKKAKKLMIDAAVALQNAADKNPDKKDELLSLRKQALAVYTKMDNV